MHGGGLQLPGQLCGPHGARLQRSGREQGQRKVPHGFRAKHGLPFRLLSDTSTEMLQAFGAWGEKKMYGKTVLGTLRRTFIFNEAGILERIIEKVDTKNAAAQILEP